MTGLAAIVAGDDDLLPELGVVLGGSGQLELGVGVLAVGALGTESGEVVHAEHSADVSVPAVGAVTAEPAVVPGTLADLRLGINVEERTFFVVAGV